MIQVHPRPGLTNLKIENILLYFTSRGWLPWSDGPKYRHMYSAEMDLSWQL